MYIVPDLLELQFPQITQGYFSNRDHSGSDKLNILCNWICMEMLVRKRSWLSIKTELGLQNQSALESHFISVTGLSPQEFADFWSLHTHGI